MPPTRWTDESAWEYQARCEAKRWWHGPFYLLVAIVVVVLLVGIAGMSRGVPRSSYHGSDFDGPDRTCPYVEC